MSNPFAGARLAPTPIQIINKNGFKVGVNLPPALKTQKIGGHEVEQSLPPYAQTSVYDVTTLNGVPPSWMPESSLYGSYVFGVRPETGLWLDFTGNSGHTHDVAAMVSVQGINAVNGKRTDSFKMEKFPGQTPCQNYLATTSGSAFWLDGFMAADGVVRQFVFTDDVIRGVAANIIGNARVQAIGISFYKSVNPKPVPVYRGATRGGGFLESFSLGAESCGATRSPKSIEVAAGARITQRIGEDPKPLSHWETNPSAVVLLYYVGDYDLQQIVAQSMPPQQEGFLQNLPKGN